MSIKVKYSKKLKLEIVKGYLKGESSTSLADESRVPAEYQILQWAHKFGYYGISIRNWFNGRILKNI